MNREDLIKETIPDPLTGGMQDIYYNKEGTFFMSIPDRAMLMPEGCRLPQYETIDNGDGSKTWKLITNE